MSMWMDTHALLRSATHPVLPSLDARDGPGLPPDRYVRRLRFGYCDGLDAVRAAVSRRRMRGARGTRLLRQQDERVEHSSALLV